MKQSIVFSTANTKSLVSSMQKVTPFLIVSSANIDHIDYDKNEIEIPDAKVVAHGLDYRFDEIESAIESHANTTGAILFCETDGDQDWCLPDQLLISLKGDDLLNVNRAVDDVLGLMGVRTFADYQDWKTKLTNSLGNCYVDHVTFNLGTGFQVIQPESTPENNPDCMTIINFPHSTNMALRFEWGYPIGSKECRIKAVLVFAIESTSYHYKERLSVEMELDLDTILHDRVY